MTNLDFTSIVKLLLSAGLLTIIWEVFHDLTSLRRERKNHYLKLITDKIFIPYHQSVEEIIYQFPQRKNTQELNELLNFFLSLINKIETDDELCFYLEHTLYRKAYKTAQGLNLLHEENNFWNYNGVKTEFLQFSNCYLELLNQSRKSIGLKKYGMIWRWKKEFQTTDNLISSIFFPFEYFLAKVCHILLKILIVYLKIVGILFVILILYASFSSSFIGK